MYACNVTLEEKSKKGSSMNIRGKGSKAKVRSEIGCQ